MALEIYGTEVVWNPKKYDPDYVTSLGIDYYLVDFLTDINSIIKKSEKNRFSYFKTNYRTAF